MQPPQLDPSQTAKLQNAPKSNKAATQSGAKQIAKLNAPRFEPLVSRLSQSRLSDYSWLRATTVTSAAASAAVSAVLPLVNSEAAAYPLTEESAKPVSVTATGVGNFSQVAVTTATNQGQALQPQVQTPPAVFSAIAPPDLITQAADGSWTLSTQAQNAPKTQAVVSQLAQSACTAGRCKGIAYIDSQLPKAQQKVLELQSQIQKFEATHAQQDMAAYQTVFANRQAEISQQKNQLSISSVETQQSLEALKLQLAKMGAMGSEINFAQQVLAQDADYQAAWQQLQRSEQSLQAEFSSVNVDATALNEIYRDYQFHQQTLYRIAGEAMSRYLSSAGTAVPDFIQAFPDSLELLQLLTITTFEHQVEQLRLETITQIEQKLSDRQNQLAIDLSEYEKLKRELAIAQQSVSQYSQERDRLLSPQSQAQSQAQKALLAESQETQSSAHSSQQLLGGALARARQLVPQLPEGSVAQGVIFTVLAAGAVAAIAARRRDAQTVLVPQLAVSTPMFTADVTRPFTQQLAAQPRLPVFSSMVAIAPPSTARSFVHEPEIINAFDDDLNNLSGNLLSREAFLTQPAPIETQVNYYEQHLLAELVELTGQPIRIIDNLPAGHAITSEGTPEDLSIEIMARDLNDLLEQSTLESDLASEIEMREIEPVQISLNDVDLLAEQAIHWVTQDLGLSSLAGDLDRAEAEVRGLAENSPSKDSLKKDALTNGSAPKSAAAQKTVKNPVFSLKYPLTLAKSTN